MSGRPFKEIPIMKKDLDFVIKQQSVYKNKIKSRPYLLESFKDTSSFITLASSTFSQDTTNFKTGTSALKSVATQVDYPARITKNVNWNLSTMQDIEIVFYIEDITKFASIELYLFKDAAAGGSGYFYQNKNGYNFKSGWNTIRFAKSEFQATNMTWDNPVLSFRINVSPTAGNAGSVIVDSMKKDVIEPANIIITFDESFASLYDIAYPYMESKGIKGTACLCSQWVDTTGRILLAQVKEMYNNGWDFISHSAKHLNYTSLGYNDIANDIQDMREWLHDNGLVRGIDIFAYPITYTAIGEKVARDLGYKCARGTSGVVNFGNQFNMMNMQPTPLDTNATFNSIKTILDRLYVTGGTLVLYMHDIMDTPTSSHVSKALFYQVIDYIATSQSQDLCKTMTYSQWYDQLFK